MTREEILKERYGSSLSRKAKVFDEVVDSLLAEVRELQTQVEELTSYEAPEEKLRVLRKLEAALNQCGFYRGSSAPEA